MPVAQGTATTGALTDQDIGNQTHHKGLAEFEEMAQPAGAAKAPIPEDHCGLVERPQRVDQQLQERGLPQVLRAGNWRLGKGRRLNRHGAAADDDSGHEHAPVMGPFRLIQRDEQLLPAPEQLQQLGCKQLIVDPRVAQQPIEAGQGTAELRP
jgi:hypothetical protein